LNRKRLLELLPGFRGKRVLVVGDLFLDEYLMGTPARISREAPVLILEFERRFGLPGGGTNPARNLSTLGSEALMAGVIGVDEAGVELRSLLEAAGIDTAGMIVDPGRPTITKTRILAHDANRLRQQMVRIDRMSKVPLETPIVSRLVEYLESTIPLVDAVLLSDYRSGVIVPEVVDVCQRLSIEHQKLLTVDSQGDLFRFKRFGLVKCNQAEAEGTLGRSLESDEDFESACGQLLEELDACMVVITRGPDGMSLMVADGRCTHIPVANRSEVFDVTGAGDTAIAVLTVALSAGASAEEAADLANYAAGLVVRKIGNATTTIEEMRQAITSAEFPRVDPDQELESAG
jgi:D-glycero-beta-D-manno-heptose-7-phosphate kinase